MLSDNCMRSKASVLVDQELDSHATTKGSIAMDDSPFCTLPWRVLRKKCFCVCSIPSGDPPFEGRPRGLFLNSTIPASMAILSCILRGNESYSTQAPASLPGDRPKWWHRGFKRQYKVQRCVSCRGARVRYHNADQPVAIASLVTRTSRLVDNLVCQKKHRRFDYNLNATLLRTLPVRSIEWTKKKTRV